MRLLPFATILLACAIAACGVKRELKLPEKENTMAEQTSSK